MTIGNINSRTRNKPSSMAYILLALLPVPTKLRNISTGSDENQRRNNREALHSVIQEILRPLNYEGPISMDCADGMRRDCFPILAAWIADHEEHMNLHNINRKLCPKCEIPLEHLGSTPSKNTFRVRNHDFYQAEHQQKRIHARMLQERVRTSFSAPSVPSTRARQILY